MGKAMEVITGFATNPSTTVTAVTMATGDSNNVRNFNSPAGAHLMGIWALGATAGITRVRSPRLHDNVQGIRESHIAAHSEAVLFEDATQYLYAQDTLTIEITGGGSETDSVSLLNYYDDLPGTAARLYTFPEIKPRIRNIMSTEVDLTTGSTLGSYGGAVPINNTFDQFKANTDYAILGYLSSVEVLTVGIRGSDFGNLRVGGPGTINRLETRRWFVNLSNAFQMPCIPVFNAANKSNTLVDLVSNASGTSVVVDVICAELATGQ